MVSIITIIALFAYYGMCGPVLVYSIITGSVVSVEAF